MDKTIAVCIGTDRAGAVRVRLSLMFVEGEEVLNEQYHSITLMPGDDPVVARASLEAHISKVGGGIPGAPWPPIPNEEWAKVTSVIAAFHTASAIAMHLRTK